MDAVEYSLRKLNVRTTDVGNGIENLNKKQNETSSAMYGTLDVIRGMRARLGDLLIYQNNIQCSIDKQTKYSRANKYYKMGDMEIDKQADTKDDVSGNTDPKGELSGTNTDPNYDHPGTNTDPKGDLPGTNTDTKGDLPGTNTDQEDEFRGTKVPAILHGGMDKEDNNFSNITNSRNIHFDEKANNFKDERGNNETKSNVEHEPEDIINKSVYRHVEVNGLKMMNDVALTDIDRVNGETGVTTAVDLDISSRRDFNDGNHEKENPLEDLIKVTEIENVYLRQEINEAIHKGIDIIEREQLDHGKVNVIEITDDWREMKQRNVSLSSIKEEELETDADEDALQHRETVEKLEEKLRKEERKFVKLAEKEKLKQEEMIILETEKLRREEEECVKLEEKLKREEEEVENLEGEKFKREEEELAKLEEELKLEEKELAKLEEEKLKRQEELAILEEEERLAREEEKLAKQIVEKEMRKLREEENFGQIQRHNQEVDEFSRKIAEEQLARLMKEEEIEIKNKKTIQKAPEEKKEAGKPCKKQPIKIPARGRRGSNGAGIKIPGGEDKVPTSARNKIMLKLGVR